MPPYNPRSKNPRIDNYKSRSTAFDRYVDRKHAQDREPVGFHIGDKP